MNPTEEFEEYTSEFQDEAENLNLAITAFEEELARITIVRTELKCQTEDGQEFTLIWSAYGKTRRPTVLALIAPMKDVQSLLSTQLKIRIAAVRAFPQFVDACLRRSAEVINELKEARQQIAAITIKLKSEPTR